MKYVRMCPECGSTDWKPSLGIIVASPDLACQECGYVGTFLEVDRNSIKETQENIRKGRISGHQAL